MPNEDEIAQAVLNYISSVNEYLMDYCIQESACDEATLRQGLDAYLETTK